MKCVAIALASAVLTWSPGPQSAPPAAQAAPELFPPPSAGLTIPAGTAARSSLAELLDKVSALTGVVYSCDANCRTTLEQACPVLTREATVLPAEVYPWVESLLLQHGFTLSVERESGPALIGVHTDFSPRGQRVSSARRLDVTLERLAKLSAHPALLVQTTLSMPSVDVRTLGNSLRGLSSGDVAILPIGATNDVAVAGTVGAVASHVALLQRIEASAAAALVSEVQSRPGDVFPPARSAIVLGEEGQSATSLAQLLAKLTAATGAAFSYDEQTGVELYQTRLQLSGPTTVPPEDVWRWAEGLLVQQGCRLCVLVDGSPPLFGVSTSASRRGGGAPAFDVTPERFALLRQHPSLLVTTNLTLPSVDVRVLSNSLRGLMADAPGFALIPVAMTHDIAVTGMARHVADAVDLLLRVEANCAAGAKQDDATKRELDAQPQEK